MTFAAERIANTERFKRLVAANPRTKRCSRCQNIKAASDFHKSSSRRTGLSSHCKECEKKNTKRYYEINKEAIKAKNAAYQKLNPNIHNKSNKKYKKAHIENISGPYLNRLARRKLGITNGNPPSDFSELWKKQLLIKREIRRQNEKQG